MKPVQSTPAEAADDGDDALSDRIARHFDGGLDADGQRRLARELAGSPEARRMLAQFLRLEAALLRLGIAGELRLLSGAPADRSALDESVSGRLDDPAPTPAPAAASAERPGHPRWRPALVWLTLAGGLLIAVVLGPRLALQPSPETALAETTDMDRVADEWLRVARTPEGDAGLDGGASPGAEIQADQEPDAGPPAWLVAAMAAEEPQRSPPDAS